MIQTPQFETQLPALHQSKRRKLQKDEHPGWAELKNLNYKDYQITPKQQEMLDSDATWFTPANINEYQGGPAEVAEQIIPTKTVATNGQDHPPLSSPEPEPEPSQDTPQDDSRFLTQAPPMMDESQAKNKSVEKELLPMGTPDVATPTPDSPLKLPNSQNHQEVGQPEELYEWGSSPPRNAKLVRQTNVKANSKKTPPPQNSDDEEVRSQPLHSSPPLRDVTPASPEEEPASSPPVSTEVLFQEDKKEEIAYGTDSVLHEDEDIPPTMEVCTAELLTQETSTLLDARKEISVEVVKLFETGVGVGHEENVDHSDMRNGAQSSAVGEEEGEEDVQSQVDDMEDVEQPATSSHDREEPASSVIMEEIIEESVEIKETIELAKPQAAAASKVPIQPNSTQSQSISTTQDDSTVTQYPQSTPSIPVQSTQEITTTEDDSQQPSQSHIPSTVPKLQETAITSATPLPPAYIIPRQESPPKATPTFLISPPNATPYPTFPPSAQIQVEETPLAAQRPGQRQAGFPSTHISATAPSNPSPGKPIEDARRKHKRDRHPGLVIPKFSRRERKRKYDLTAILLEDRKRFRIALQEADQGFSQVQPPKEESGRDEPMPEDPKEKAVNEDEPMEEVIEASVEAEKAPTQSQPSFAQLQPGQQISSQSFQTSQQFPDTQDDSQMFNPLQTRWGRFTAHWRRFSQPPSHT